MLNTQGPSPGLSGSGGCLPGLEFCLSQHVNEAEPLLWTEFLTHASETITLPQTSFAGGNKGTSANQSQ